MAHTQRSRTTYLLAALDGSDIIAVCTAAVVSPARVATLQQIVLPTGAIHVFKEVLFQFAQASAGGVFLS